MDRQTTDNTLNASPGGSLLVEIPLPQGAAGPQTEPQNCKQHGVAGPDLGRTTRKNWTVLTNVKQKLKRKNKQTNKSEHHRATKRVRVHTGRAHLCLFSACIMRGGLSQGRFTVRAAFLGLCILLVANTASCCNLHHSRRRCTRGGRTLCLGC
jgi:hypothetical protein